MTADQPEIARLEDHTRDGAYLSYCTAEGLKAKDNDTDHAGKVQDTMHWCVTITNKQHHPECPQITLVFLNGKHIANCCLAPLWLAGQ